MSAINSIGKALENKTLTKVAEGATATVLIMTGIKAVARPAFIYADKKSDAETKKYTAVKEFLYQLLCLGITFAVLPLFKKGGTKLAENVIKKNNTTNEALKKTILKGGNETGALVGSILGLTILAPLLSHGILHPIMKAIGMEKKESKKNPALEKLEQPILPEAHHKVNVDA